MGKEEIPTYINTRMVVFNSENSETFEIELFWPDYAYEYTVLSLQGGETIFVYMYAEGALINYMAGGSIENSGISRFEIELDKILINAENYEELIEFSQNPDFFNENTTILFQQIVENRPYYAFNISNEFEDGLYVIHVNSTSVGALYDTSTSRGVDRENDAFFYFKIEKNNTCQK